MLHWCMSLVRVNKHLADLGLVSRREADEYIAEGKVLVNGKKAVMGQKVDPAVDTVEIKDKRTSFVYYAYHKPKGIVTTGAQEGETDIVHHTEFPRPVFPIGRLDKESTGLIIMTNDRKLTTKLLSDDDHYEKEYVVKTLERLTPMFLEFLREGVPIRHSTFQGKRKMTTTKRCAVERIDAFTFAITLTEGRNRQIKKMCAAFNYTVKSIHRIRIGNITIDSIPKGTFKRLTADQVYTQTPQIHTKDESWGEGEE